MVDVTNQRRRVIWGASFAVAMGGLIGLGIFTFVYAEGASYLSDDPTSCINCHVMQPHYDAWLKSSHASVATCNDCHVPPGNFLKKYHSKAINGFNHSWAFTTGRFPDRIMITEPNRRIVESACRECHQAMTTAIDSVHRDGETMSCVRCHASVAHGP